MYVGNQLARIHIGKKSMGLSDDEYRDFLFGLTKKRSSKKMTLGERTLVISKMIKMGAFKKQKKKLSKQEKACVAKW